MRLESRGAQKRFARTVYGTHWLSHHMKAGMEKRLSVPWADAEAHVQAALKTEGFGVLTRIDVQATFKEKLGVEFPRHLILGACNPGFAHRALTAEPAAGLLLPCNVTLSEDAEGVLVRIGFTLVVMRECTSKNSVGAMMRRQKV